MTRPAAFPLLLLVIGSGCSDPQPVILRGDANSVEVTYVGSTAKAEPLARRHCSQFEKMPHFISTDGETVLFDCIRR
jgi:hypothetical protein